MTPCASESRLIATLASAPSSPALASAIAVVRSELMFGFVIGLNCSAIRFTRTTRSATPSGTLVAPRKAAAISLPPSGDSFAAR